MIKQAILKISKHQDLTYDEAYQTMDEIMSGEASEVQMSAYLTAMSMKGETIPQFKSISSSVLSFIYSPTLTSIHDHWKNHSLD